MQARTTDRPRFRQDLVAESIDDQGSRFIDVMDPDSGSVFRFFEVEYSLACAMDGQRDVAGIVQWAREELGVTPSPREVRTVIATLGELGFIDGIDAGIVPGRRGADTELARGVVVGDRADTIPGDTMDVELGEAGATADGHVNNDMPRAPNLTLGAPGASTPARHAPAEDIPLGMPGPGDIRARITEPEIQVQPARDVSLDLSDQMTVRPDDVKEAVRASKVMKAVEVPKDLMDALESAEMDPNAQTKVSPTPALRPTPPPRPTPRPMPAVTPPAAAAGSAIPVPSRDIPPTRPTPSPVKPHVETKTPVTATERPPIGAGMTTRRTSPALVVVLIIVIFGAAVFALWKFVLDTSSDEAPTKSSVVPAPGSDVAVAPTKPTKVEEPPKVAPPAKAKLSTEPEPPEDLKSPVAGTIDTIEPNDKAVKPGDVIARLAGHKAIEGDITTLAFDVDKRLPGAIDAAQKELDAATAANNPANVTAAQKKLDDAKKALEDKQAQLAAKNTELDKFVIKATSAGKLSAISKSGGKVLTDEVVARIAREPVLTATFDVKGSKLAAGAAVKLTDDAHPDKSYDCTVAEVSADKLKVTCPSDPTLDGIAVTLASP
ncbi:MAG TPA: hypothetical protein VGO00_28085 [Kofleriaceae bacterium]|nr:hypothetical protein [Kofleriaceae bacterium]